MAEMGASGVGHNNDFDWDGFDPEAYYAHNYRTLRSDDQRIIEYVRDHFCDAIGETAASHSLRGIDVGTGSNLYPALTMLPFCAELTLYERSRNNITWLEKQKIDRCPSWTDSWHQFWQVLAKQSVYDEIGDPPAQLAARMKPVSGSVYELKGDPPYDVGTMFFVAESITEEESEFRSGIDHFLDALAPEAPFAIAFMEHSSGYDVGDRHFPATDIDSSMVYECLKDRVIEVPRIEHIDPGVEPVREGYTGMLIALGRVKGSSERGVGRRHETAAASADPGRMEVCGEVFA